jgi:ATP-binding cassette subfamily B protein
MNIHSRIVRYYRPFGLSILGALGILILSIGFNLLKPWPVKYVVDSLLVADNKLPWWIPADTFQGALLMSVLALVGIHLIWGALNLCANFWLIRIGLDALIRLRGECFQKLQLLALKFHDRHPSGDLVFRVAYDTQSIQTFFNRGFGTVVGSCLTLVGIVLVMWQMNVFLTLLSLLVVPLLLVAIWLFAGRVRHHSNRVQEEESRVLQRLNDSLLNMRLIRVLGRGGAERTEFLGACRDSLDAARSLDRTNLVSTWVVGVITALGGALLLYFGAREVQAGDLRVGDLWVFLSYLAMLYQPLEQLSYTAWAMEGAAAGAERVFRVLDDPNIEENETDLPDLPPLEGKIEFSGVDFSYDQGRPVLENVQAVIEPGQTVGVCRWDGRGENDVAFAGPPAL